MADDNEPQTNSSDGEQPQEQPQPKARRQAKPADERTRLDEFDGQPFYLDAQGRKVDPDGRLIQDKK